MQPCVVESIALAAENGASDLQVALVGAGAAIFGGLVGGAVTGWVTLKAEDKRQIFTKSLETERLKQEAERESAIVRGAARVWRTRLREAKALYEAQAERGVWMPQPFPVTDQPPIEDRKLIASALSASEWRSLERAEIALAVLESLHRTVLTATPVDLSFSTSQQSTVPLGIERFNAGMDALSAAAGLEATRGADHRAPGFEGD
jgi:hypothetical protein